MQVEKYDFDLEGWLAKSRYLAEKGASYSDIIAYLHDQNVSLVDSVEVISDLYKIDMSTGKIIVFSHPIWSQDAESASALHDTLIEGLKRVGKFTEKYGLLSVRIKL